MSLNYKDPSLAPSSTKNEAHAAGKGSGKKHTPDDERTNDIEQRTILKSATAINETVGFEDVLVNGILGFALSCNNAALGLLVAVFNADFAKDMFIPTILMAVAIVVVLRAGKRFADALQTGVATKTIYIAHSVCFVVMIVTLLLQSYILAIIFAGLGLTLTAFIYGDYLAYLDRKALALILNIVFMFIGISFIMFTQMQSWALLAVFTLTTILSVTVTLLQIKRRLANLIFISKTQSKDRSIKVKGNNNTLFLLGFMFSMASASLLVDVDMVYTLCLLGGAVALAGIVSQLFNHINEKKYKETMLKSCALVSVIFLLPLPLLPPLYQLVAISIFVLLVTLNVIILINGVVETARFNVISPIWLFGKEGSVFFIGVILGETLLILEEHFLDLAYTQIVVCIITVAICSFMQLRVNYQVYPFEPVLDVKDDDEIKKRLGTAGRHKALWHKKREYAADICSLSPREREILYIILRGRDAKYIMDTLFISQSTAKTHVYNIYKKFNVHSRQDLFDYIEEIELPPEYLSELIADPED